ncbi:MAG: hypothetical protein Q8K30_02370 [Candidatus Gracilibacteria bacterium]|nr:hypothetical protein [Candidatus Gracilibacteria bacterium]
MIKTSPDIDNTGYCSNCPVNYSCLNCEVMNQLVDSRYKLISVIEEVLDYNKSNNINQVNIKEQSDAKNYVPICGNCGKKMRISKNKKGAKYWCNCRN